MKVKHHVTHKNKSKTRARKKKRKIINQSHKSRWKHWNVIERNMNVAKLRTLLSKSHNNDTNMKMLNGSLWLSRNRQSAMGSVCVAALNQLVNGILIFVGALSLQGENKN